jgi:peroxiredoxin
VQFIAITGEVPDTSLTFTEKNGLRFPVLSDVGLKLARKLGIVWKQPADMDNIFNFLKIDWKKDYGVDEKELPIPATIFVGKDGIVKEVFVEANFHERLDPEAAVAWIDKHKL